MRFLLLFIILFSFTQGTAQFPVILDCDDDNICCKKNNADSLPVALVLDTINSGKISDPKFLACCYHQIGVHYYNDENDYLSAIVNYNEALKIRQETKDEELWKSHLNLGLAYFENKQYKKAKESFFNCFKENEEQRSKGWISRYIGQAYYGLGDLENAEKILKESIEQGGGAAAHNSLCLALTIPQDTTKLRQAVAQADIAVRLYKEGKSSSLAQAYNNRGIALGWLQEYERAYTDYNSALSLYGPQEYKQQAQVINNISTELYREGKYQLAIEKLQTSLSLKKKYHNKEKYHPDYAANYENLAENYEALNQIDSAFVYYQLALINITDGFKNTDITVNPLVEKDYYIYNKPDLLRVLNLKAQVAKKAGKIDLAYQTYQDIDAWINEFYKDLSSDESKLLWIAEAHQLYGNAIEVALEQGKEEQAFQYAEKAHAVLLLQNLSQQAALSFISVPSDLEKKENLQLEILQVDQLYRNGILGLDSLRMLKEKQEQFERELEEKYPDYKNRKYQPQNIQLSDVQNNILNRRTALLEYFFTDDSLYIFLITKKDLVVVSKSINGLIEEIDQLLEMLQSTRMGSQDYSVLAHDLYKKLFPAQLEDYSNINRLLIIPDREIGRIPFSALVTEQTDKTFGKDYPFLVHKYITNYLYSCDSYQQLQGDTKQFTSLEKIIGIAPVNYDFAPWRESPLKETGKQVEELVKIYDGKTHTEKLKNEAATKKATIEALQVGYHTIHFATHAIFNNEDGQIILRDDALTQNEIDLIPVKTYRLVLGACETAVGEINSGEGVLSLGWSFAQKGVASITMTHWKIKEAPTMDITTNYHRFLNDGVKADKALQKAQLEYLGSSYTTEYSYHPHYWAGLIHTGNVANSSGNSIWIKMLFLLSISILFLIVGRKYFGY